MNRVAIAEAPGSSAGSSESSGGGSAGAQTLQVFILGPARSGTSITYHAMREVFGLPGDGEGHVIPIFQRVIHEYYRYSMDFRETKGVLARRLDTASFRNHVYDFVRRTYYSIYPDRAWVDKTPGSEALVGVELILSAFPEAKIILTTRTGVEVVESFRRKFSRSFEDACRVWADCMRAAQMVRDREFPILEVDQYDLTNEPALAASRIARFLGRSEKEADLARFFSDRRVEKSSTHDWTRRQTLSNVDWSDDEKAIFTEICGDWMGRLGYPIQ